MLVSRHCRSPRVCSTTGSAVPAATSSHILAEAFRPRWWLVVFPGLALTLTVVTANLFGDALRDFLDPKLRGRVL